MVRVFRLLFGSFVEKKSNEVRWNFFFFLDANYSWSVDQTQKDYLMRLDFGRANESSE